MTVITKCPFCGKIINIPDRNWDRSRRDKFNKEIGWVERKATVKGKKVREYFHKSCLYKSKG